MTLNSRVSHGRQSVTAPASPTASLGDSHEVLSPASATRDASAAAHARSMDAATAPLNPTSGALGELLLPCATLLSSGRSAAGLLSSSPLTLPRKPPSPFPPGGVADAEGENALKVILLGDSAVGKSKLVERFLVRPPPTFRRPPAHGLLPDACLFSLLL